MKFLRELIIYIYISKLSTQSKLLERENNILSNINVKIVSCKKGVL